MNDQHSPTANTIEGLRAENARLRAALAQASIRARDQANRLLEREGEHGAELAAKHSDISKARSDTRLSCADLAASEMHVADLEALRDTLAISEERLALVFEASGSIGWWDWDIPNDRLYANAFFARLYGVDPQAAATGAPLAAFVSGIHPDDRDWVGGRIRHAIETAGEFAEEYRLQKDDGTIIWIYARGRCYHDSMGNPIRYPGVSIDITARKMSDAALAASEASLSTIMETVPVGILVAEAPSGRILSGNGKLSQILGHDTRFASSSAGYDVFEAFHANGQPIKGSEYPLARICAGECDRATLEANYQRPDGSRIWISIVGEAIKDAQGRTIGAVVAVSDISDRKASDAKRELLNHELAHRLKNTLAVVQSIVTQTLRSAPDLSTAREALTKRIQILSKAHDILLSGHGNAGAVETIIAGAVSLHDPNGRISLHGPNLNVGPRAALTLALIMHELSTNAAKYGALSVARGTVSVTWSVKTDEATMRPTLTLTWLEIDGPPVTPPNRKGFGTRLIEMGLSGSVGGVAKLEYAPDGLRYQLIAPLTELQADND